MKKLLTFVGLVVFLLSTQLAFGDAIITVNATADIPTIKGRAARLLQETPSAEFDYILEGSISEASIHLQWGTSSKWSSLGRLLQLDLYLDDVLLIDFGKYFKSLSWKEKIGLMTGLRKGKMIDLDVVIDPADFDDLVDGANLYLVGRPTFFSGLRLGDITLTINDPSPPGPGAPVPSIPEPATMLLLGSGLLGLAAYGKKKFLKM